MRLPSRYSKPTMCFHVLAFWTYEKCWRTLRTATIYTVFNNDNYGQYVICLLILSGSFPPTYQFLETSFHLMSNFDDASITYLNKHNLSLPLIIINITTKNFSVFYVMVNPIGKSETMKEIVVINSSWNKCKKQEQVAYWVSRNSGY